MPLPFPFADNYADLESEALLILEPSDKNDIKNKKREYETGSDISINLLQSVLSNPLSALSEFNWRGERMMEQLQKHKVNKSNNFFCEFYYQNFDVKIFLIQNYLFAGIVQSLLFLSCGINLTILIALGVCRYRGIETHRNVPQNG